MLRFGRGAGEATTLGTRRVRPAPRQAYSGRHDGPRQISRARGAAFGARYPIASPAPSPSPRSSAATAGTRPPYPPQAAAVKAAAPLQTRPALGRVRARRAGQQVALQLAVRCQVEIEPRRHARPSSEPRAASVQPAPVGATKPPAGRQSARTVSIEASSYGMRGHCPPDAEPMCRGLRPRATAERLRARTGRVRAAGSAGARKGF